MEEKTQKSNSAMREEEVLKFWKANETFKKSLEKVSPKGEYVFYEGPPTANGKPGIHHLEARAFKDAIPRYKTMQGFHVRRKAGWDTHGLPVEIQVEKKLGLTSKKAIEEYGIAAFNKECKESVWEYTDLWKKFTERTGYWVDSENPYVTYHNNYIESVWSVIKKVNDQGLLYKDYKVVPWCPRCGTGLSSHELAQGYLDVKDLSVTAKFKLKGQESTFILAWTTTPWTLPGNVALAIGEKIDYVKIQKENEFYILAKSRLSVIEGEYKIIEEFKGKDLIGKEYEPLYPYFSNTVSDVEKPKMGKAFKVYGASFVTTEDGTGVVHTAVMYGIEDFNLGNEIGLPKHHMVGLDGKFLPETDFLAGRFVRDEDVAVDIIKDLAHRGLLFKKEKFEHSYPHCWRCKTALIYYARDSWYIRMSALKDKLVKENEGINWEPANIKEGRFGDWLREIKDWAISRERYWGSPLPVWSCESCKKLEVIGSIADLKSKVKKSGNKYFVMRHGEADNNVFDLVSSSYNNQDKLTEKGRDQATKGGEDLKDKKIDLILCSPFLRTKETAEIVASIIGLDKDSIIIDDRLHEMSLPMYEGKTWQEYHKDYPNTVESFYHPENENESYNDVKKRTMGFLYSIEKSYEGKNILIVTHGGPCWLAIAGTLGYTAQESLDMIKNFNYLNNAEARELDFTPLPHDENFELDLHRPFIDEVDLVCSCGGHLVRSKEVMDVWLDSGTMPFSQDHYPFENKELVEGPGYPADFISEAIDQTRGWFYTLHAVGILMGRGKAYKNVICLGHLLDANGKKMSKSLGNIIDPWTMMDKYGVDTLRLWMYSVNQPGESKNFDEKTVSELHSKVFNLLYNVLAFYELYRDKSLENDEYKSSSNILDKWIISRLGELTEIVTSNMENYKLLEPVRAIRDFMDDLSTWYVRRSRERIKDGDLDAKKTLYCILKTLSKLMAPFTPFASEDIWQKLKNEKDLESVHLVSWPESTKIDLNLIKEMKEVREVVTLGLEARQKAGIRVRQPLSKITIAQYKFVSAINKLDYFSIIQEELNIKEIDFHDELDLKLCNSVLLDTYITDDLQKEGQYRELVRAIQDMRKKAGLNPNDMISLEVATSVDGQQIINKWKNELLKAIGSKEISIKENNGVEVKIDELIFVINIVK
jgi:isoleucyl-tRNA synthetase